MALLTAKHRNALPKSNFGMPGERKYPMPDAAHAQNAKARASAQVNKGAMSPGTEAKIDAKANRVMGKHGGSIGKAAAGGMHHPRQTTQSVSSDRGTFGIKG